MAIVSREKPSERVITSDSRRDNLERILEDLGFTPKTSKIDSSKKVWNHSKITYIHIFTKATTYHVRLYSIDNPNYSNKEKQYGNERHLIDILADV